MLYKAHKETQRNLFDLINNRDKYYTYTQIY